MSIKKKILALCYPILRLSNLILYFLGVKQKGRLRVLTYHEIHPSQAWQFERQLRWLSKSWEFVTPDVFLAMKNGDSPIDRDYLLLTFDDGFISNRQVADTILAEMGIYAVFFVVSEFVKVNDDLEMRKFVSEKIIPGMDPSLVLDCQGNMTWDDLAVLIKQGHSIGAYTANHSRLSKVDNQELEAEIIASADEIEARLGVKVSHFAYTFGNLLSISPQPLEVAFQRFPYIYTGFRGDNCNTHNWALRRDAVNPPDSLFLIGAFLEGSVDWIRNGDIEVYETWLNQSQNDEPL